MEIKDLISYAQKAIGNVWLVWGFHTTVVIATIGWLLSEKKKKFEKVQKTVATIAYLIFYVVVLMTFNSIYEEICRIVVDLNAVAAGKVKLFPDNGYVKQLLNYDYWDHYWKPLVVCSLFAVFIMILIWNDRIWKEMKETSDM